MTRPGPRLFITYAVVSLIPVVLLGALLMWHDKRANTDRALRQAEDQANVIMQMAIAPALDTRSLSEGLTAAELSRLWAATDLSIYTGSVAAIRLRSFDGTVVFADDSSPDGEPAVGSPDFQAALDGGTAARIMPDPREPTRRTIRVIRPIVPSATGQATGIMQLYLPYEQVAESIESQQRETQIYLAAGLGLLYLVLAAITWSSSQRLRRYAQQQEHAARHDPLTGIPNRGHFEDVVGEALARGEVGAIGLVDLDRFKDVNDTAGHRVGDELLTTVARRMAARVRACDMVARLGGDEFGVFLPGIATVDEAVVVLERVRRSLVAPVRVADTTLAVSASFGAALFPVHGDDLSTLLHHADTAMYRAKRDGDSIAVAQPDVADLPEYNLTQCSPL